MLSPFCWIPVATRKMPNTLLPPPSWGSAWSWFPSLGLILTTTHSPASAHPHPQRGAWCQGWGCPGAPVCTAPGWGCGMGPVDRPSHGAQAAPYIHPKRSLKPLAEWNRHMAKVNFHFNLFRTFCRDLLGQMFLLPWFRLLPSRVIKMKMHCN